MSYFRRYSGFLRSNKISLKPRILTDDTGLTILRFLKGDNEISRQSFSKISTY